MSGFYQDSCAEFFLTVQHKEKPLICSPKIRENLSIFAAEDILKGKI